MQVQSINNQNNISMRALYFPTKPETGAIVRNEIKIALKRNPFIKELSEATNVLARFISTNDGKQIHHYHLRLDVFNKENKEEVASMLYSSRTDNYNGAKNNLSETEFISHIEKPQKIIKIVNRGNWFDRLLKLKKEKIETLRTQTDYYNFSFLHENDTYPINGITPALTKELNNAEKEVREINTQVINGLVN